MLPLTTVFAMSVISVFTGVGVACFLKSLIDDDTKNKRLALLMTGMFSTVATMLFLMVHIK